MQFVLNQLVYFGFLQSVFLLGIYTFSTTARKNINPYLIVLIAVLLIGLSGRVMHAAGLFGSSYRLIVLSEYATFLFGATVYLFVRSSLSGREFQRQDLFHYLPGVAYICTITFYYQFAPDPVIAERIKSGELFWAVVIFMGTGLLVNIGYWIMSYRLFLSFRNRLMNEVSFTVKSRFLQNFLLGIGICLGFWLIVYMVGIFQHTWLERAIRPYIWLGIAFIILFIAYYIIRDPALFKTARLVNGKKYALSKLSAEELGQLKKRLDQLMVEKKPYLNRNLMKADLAEMLGVNHPEIARVLNEQIGMNFFEYVNYFRIKEFVELARSDKAQSLTFFGLAQEAGFNSKTTFNKSFRKIMGSSPTEYFASEVS